MSDTADEWSIEWILEQYGEDGYAFEELVCRVYTARGFQTAVTPKSQDDGIDLWARDPDGNTRGVQVKRYDMGNPVRQIDVGYLAGAAIAEPVYTVDLVTTSTYTEDAWRFATKLNAAGVVQMELISGDEFVDWVNEYMA